MSMKVEVNSSKKILQVTLDGFVTTDAAAKVLAEYNQIIGRVKLADSLEADRGCFEYVGDEYGYTGTISPFVALSHAIQNQEIQRSDTIVFWPVGSGYISCAMLWKY